jgi:hypothetical protein
LVFSRSSSFYELLDVEPDADRSTVMAAWMDKRRAAVAMTSMVGSEEVEAVCSRLDEAFRTLTHPLRGKRYQRYHGFSRAEPRMQPGDHAESGESDELPSILAVSKPAGQSPTFSPAASPSGWVQMSLPLLHAVEAEVPEALASADPSVSAFDELQVSADSAAAFRKSEPLVTVELLDTLELLEEALTSEPKIPKTAFRII